MKFKIIAILFLFITIKPVLYTYNLVNKNVQFNQISSDKDFDYLQMDREEQDRKSFRFAFFILFIPLFYRVTYFFFRKEMANRQYFLFWISGLITTFIICFYLYLNVIPKIIVIEFVLRLPVFLQVFLLSIIDGFTSGSFFVLIIFFALLAYAKNKKQILIVGVIFIIFHQLLNFFSILLLDDINKFKDVSLTPIYLFFGILFMIAGFFNIKNYIPINPVIKNIIPEMINKGFKSRKIISRESRQSFFFLKIFAILILIIIITLIVNLIELNSKSVILPSFLYLMELEVQSLMIKNLYYFIYSLLSTLPLILILFNFLFSIQFKKNNTSQIIFMKFISGIFMIMCSIIFLFFPDLLDF